VWERTKAVQDVTVVEVIAVGAADHAPRNRLAEEKLFIPDEGCELSG
jgi:hypothetical protein